MQAKDLEVLAENDLGDASGINASPALSQRAAVHSLEPLPVLHRQGERRGVSPTCEADHSTSGLRLDARRGVPWTATGS